MLVHDGFAYLIGKKICSFALLDCFDGYFDGILTRITGGRLIINVESWNYWGNGTVCEPRYVDAIVESMTEFGLEVEHG